LNIIKRNKMIIGVMLITLILTATMLYFNLYRFNGYKVSIDKNIITYVKTKKEFNKTYLQLQYELESKYRNVIMKNNFTFENTKVDDTSIFISGNKLKNIMLKKLDIVVDGFVMKSDNKKVAYLISENQGKVILNCVKDYYSKGAKLNSITKIDIVNKISYEPIKIKTRDLYENYEIASEIIKYDAKAKIPFITVKVLGSISIEQSINPTTIMIVSSQLMEGASKIHIEGKAGTQKVTTEVITLNNKRLSERVLKSEIIIPVQNKEVYVGNYKPLIVKSASMNSPSRGSISSNFGMRWGRMHKGIDIAANFGATINGVLDGIVSYAGWEEGYGNVIKINHGGGIETTYAHCSVINVKKGEVVKTGQKIGEVGSTGNSTGPHLHFEVRENGEAINPQKYIK